ncbi:MAG: outer membrane lipoprotein-sorting protein [Myxococcales bacterium]|nr:outer membrane lipoprotein-sorting protein [Myxococcales bacterium]
MSRNARVFFAVAAAAAALMVWTPLARAGEVEDLLSEIDDMWRERSSEATVDMNVKTANYERHMRMKAWSKGKDHSLIRIERPLKEKDTATLKSGEDIYTYLPKTDRTIRLTSGMMMGSWMGSHFTNDDLVKESRLLDDYTAAKEGERKVDGHRVVDIQLIPKEDAAVVWGKILISVDTDRRIPIKAVYYDEDMKVARTMTYSNLKEVDGKVRPMTMRVVPADKPDEFTELDYSELKFDVDLKDSFFSIGNLRKR